MFQIEFSTSLLRAEECLICAATVLFYVFFLVVVEDGSRLPGFHHHITLFAVLVGPMTLMTCGMLVLFTLLNEVSLCTNRPKWPFNALWGTEGVTGIGVLRLERADGYMDQGSHERLD